MSIVLADTALEGAENIRCEIDGDNLVLRVNLTHRIGDSKSGRSVLVATSRGNKTLSVGKDTSISIGMNIYIPKQGEA